MPPEGASRLSGAITLPTRTSISPMFTRSFTYSFSFTHLQLLVYLLFHLVTYSHILTLIDSFTYSLTHLRALLLIHSLAH